jgi:hypothetical protein
MVSHDENSHDIANDTKQKMIWESLQIDTAEIMLANSEGFRPVARNIAARRKIRQRAAAAQPARSMP